MIKRLFAVLAISFSLAAGITGTTSVYSDCEHYFETVSLAGVSYLIEYSCDGSVVAVTVIDD